ncbi:hypothetical protein, unlikely [Trypanosoma brucei gambiense DAL972]|uniref:Uncharacterized protein n=1 Tax=Trypanosoma brucei gambiense (strain MHOM/CI/86/DAL972) TaxID=679716 RepID=D0A747_TRYB9|nr:hypothetical protein, unlikely [Trypanosoma brucei gambiense DAL972]CBH17498.1 hypothetical protein, unlikely [Trypanosoma brucei gambiense DAL972]|eukprot:XP_011779762.1 hypothetical protein, unlikely [Trypanosoma brucei gambiense DAL972]
MWLCGDSNRWLYSRSQNFFSAYKGAVETAKHLTHLIAKLNPTKITAAQFFSSHNSLLDPTATRYSECQLLPLALCGTHPLRTKKNVLFACDNQRDKNMENNCKENGSHIYV